MSFEDTSIQKVSEYWNSRPCNIRHSTKPIGSKEYSDEVEARKYFIEPHIRSATGERNGRCADTAARRLQVSI